MTKTRDLANLISDSKVGPTEVNTTGSYTFGSVSVDNITIDGTEIDLSSGDLTIDVAGDINLDADGGDVILKDGGSEFGRFVNSSDRNLVIQNTNADKDISFLGNDNGSSFTALNLDMSEGGRATFNDVVRIPTNLEHDGDADTFFGFPGANNFIITAGNVSRVYGSATETVINEDSVDLDFRVESDANTHALFLEGSSGNVGIGTSSPDRVLHIKTADNIIGLIESTDADAWLAFQDNTSSTNNAVRVGATGDNLRFYAGSAERMRIDSSGNVGIGTTSPDADLTLPSPSYGSGGTGNGIRFQNTNNDADAIIQTYYSGTSASALLHGQNLYLATNASFTNFDSSKGSSYILQNTDGQILFGNASSSAPDERMRIDASGNVGIGTTSPDDVLEIKDSTNNTTRQVKIVDSSDATATHIGQFNNTSYFTNNAFYNGSAWTRDDGAVGTAFLGLGDGVIQFGVDTGNTPNERMRINSSGNVLVGTTTARSGSKVVIDGGAADTFIHLDSDSFDGTYKTGIRFSTNTISSTNYFQGEIAFKGTNSYSGDLIFSSAFSGTTNAVSEKMRITSSGNVGIGTTSPSEKLHVQGDGADIVITDAGGGETAKLGSTGSNHGVLELKNSSHSTQVFLHSSGNSYFNGGDVGIGTTSPVTNSNYATLTISDTTGGQTHFKSTGGSVTAYVGADSTSSGVGYLATETNHPLLLRTNNTERARINANGQASFRNGIAFRPLAHFILTTSYQDICEIDTNNGDVGRGFILAVSSENNYHQHWNIQVAQNSISTHFFGGDSGHGHSKDVQWRKNNSHIQAKRSLSTGRALALYCAAGACILDFDE